MSGRPYERMLNFSDGVVAVAVTVMVLPVVDLEGPSPSRSVLDIIQAHSPLISGYFTAFLIVALIWIAHHRVMERLDAYDNTIMLLNTAWLATIAFFPWCTELTGEAKGFKFGVGELFFATLAVNTLMLLLITWHARRFPDLLRPGASILRRDQWIRLYFLGVFGGLGLLSIATPFFAGILLYPLIIIGPLALPLCQRLWPESRLIRRGDQVLASRPPAEHGGDGG